MTTRISMDAERYEKMVKERVIKEIQPHIIAVEKAYALLEKERETVASLRKELEEMTQLAAALKVRLLEKEDA